MKKWIELNLSLFSVKSDFDADFVLISVLAPELDRDTVDKLLPVAQVIRVCIQSNNNLLQAGTVLILLKMHWKRC